MMPPARRSAWIAVAVAAAAVFAVAAVVAGIWSDLGDTEISLAGWAAMALGIGVTLALGIGLMSLVFISHHRGYDERGVRRR